jgi:hypothetical protein
MGQVLPRDTTTTEAIRRAIQPSQESLRALARHGINPGRRLNGGIVARTLRPSSAIVSAP